MSSTIKKESVAYLRKERLRRHARLRKIVKGNPDRPRLAVFRSNRNISAQVIDDENSRTICSASTLEDVFKSSSCGNLAAAEKVGTLIAERALACGITKVVFDKAGYHYHGRVGALADSARKAGLEF